MKFDDEQFPNFKEYLRTSFVQLANNKVIVDGLVKWGKMPEETTRHYIVFGSNPLILVAEGSVVDKNIDHRFPHTISLLREAVDAFENKDDSKWPLHFHTGKGKNVFRVGILILRQLISGHLNLISKDPVSSKTVWARTDAFENEVYGGITDG